RCVPLNGRSIFLHAPYSRQGFFSGTANRNLSPAPLRREGAGETISRSDLGRRNPARSAPRRDVWVAATRYLVERAGFCRPFRVPLGERSGPCDGCGPSTFIVRGPSPSVRSVLLVGVPCPFGSASRGSLVSFLP